MRIWGFAATLLTLTACQNGPFPEGATPGGAEPTAPLPVSAPGRALVAGETSFSAALFREVAAAPGSVVVSPHGVFATLGMLREGARGGTAAALDAALGFGGEAAGGWSWLHQGLRSATTLRSASAVWTERHVPPSAEFLRLLADRHGAVREAFDVTHPDATAVDVNAWAARHTEGRIAEIFTASDVKSDARLLLTNAVYFHDRWATRFPREATQEEDFHAAPDRTLRVPMMHVSARFELATVGAARVLALPHRGPTELLVVLPAPDRTLAEVEAELGKGALTTWGGERDQAEVDVSLPRFRVDSNHDLVPALTALGVGVAFRPGAELEGIGIEDPLGPLFVSDLRQRALLECDEEGTTAAAVTMAVASCSAGPASPVEFRCDRPFLFVLRHLPTGALLFVGRYAG